MFSSFVIDVVTLLFRAVDKRWEVQMSEGASVFLSPEGHFSRENQKTKTKTKSAKQGRAAKFFKGF